MEHNHITTHFPRYSSVKEQKDLPVALEIEKTYQVRLNGPEWHRQLYGVFIESDDGKFHHRGIWIESFPSSGNKRLVMIVKVETSIPWTCAQACYYLNDVQSIHFFKHFSQFKLEIKEDGLYMKLGYCLKYSVKLTQKEK